MSSRSAGCPGTGPGTSSPGSLAAGRCRPIRAARSGAATVPDRGCRSISSPTARRRRPGWGRRTRSRRGPPRRPCGSPASRPAATRARPRAPRSRSPSPGRRPGPRSGCPPGMWSPRRQTAACCWPRWLSWGHPPTRCGTRPLPGPAARSAGLLLVPPGHRGHRTPGRLGDEVQPPLPRAGAGPGHRPAHGHRLAGREFRRERRVQPRREVPRPAGELRQPQRRWGTGHGARRRAGRQQPTRGRPGDPGQQRRPGELRVACAGRRPGHRAQLPRQGPGGVLASRRAPAGRRGPQPGAAIRLARSSTSPATCVNPGTG